jgi:putative transposase
VRAGGMVRKRGPHQAMGLYAHVTWHTWRRERSIRASDVPIVVRAFTDASTRSRIRIHVQAVLADHIHLMVSYPPSANLSDFVRDAKSESARRVNHAHGSGDRELRWCHGFYANSVCRSHLDLLRSYIGRQYRRHPDRIPARVG